MVSGAKQCKAIQWARPARCRGFWDASDASDSTGLDQTYLKKQLQTCVSVGVWLIHGFMFESQSLVCFSKTSKHTGHHHHHHHQTSHHRL